MNKLALLLLAATAFAASGAPARAWDDAVGCSSKPGPRMQQESVPIKGTGHKIIFRTPRTEQRYVKDETMTLLMNVSLITKADVIVTSGYRSCDYTKKIRGRNLSRHTQGDAADFKSAGLSSSQLFQVARQARARGAGTYCGKDFSHLDLGTYRQWNHCGKNQ